MKLVRRIFISLGIMFFAVCCGAMLLTHWSAFGWKALAIPTGSMRPNIPPGSLVNVVDHRGQAVSAFNRLHFSSGLPTLSIWGDHDRINPVAHAGSEGFRASSSS